MKFAISKNKEFSKFSGDKNPIHININHAKKFFIKKPIVHGANIVINSLTQKNFEKKKFNNLKIFFKDFITVNEEFNISESKKKITIKGKYNNKIEIFKKFDKNKNALNTKKIIKELLFISRYIGNIYPGTNSLIQQIEFNIFKSNNNKRKIEKRIINKNIKIISYLFNNLKVEITAIKLKPYPEKKINNFLNLKKFEKILKDKKIVIYGKNSDLGTFLYNSNIKKVCNLKLLSFSNINKNTLKQDLKNIKPDFIFYFFSPKILNGNSQKILDYYKYSYIDIPLNIFKILSKYKKKFKIFYPSTIFINQPKRYKYLKSYIDTKKMAEKIFKKKIYKKSFFVKRLPMLKTRSNYNVYLGKYLGYELKYLKKDITNFFIK